MTVPVRKSEIDKTFLVCYNDKVHFKHLLLEGLSVAQRKNKTTAEQTAEQVKKLLFSGCLKPGEKLPSEVTLAEQLQVSRPTLREALRILQSSGHIKQIPNRGCFARITDPTEEKRVLSRQAHTWIRRNGTSLDEFFQARTVLEPHAAAIAARRGDPEAIAAIEKALIAFEQADIHSPQQMAKLDNDIHTAIVRAAGNRHLESFFAELTCFFVEYSSYSFVHVMNTHRTAGEHRAVYDAIRTGDADAAQAAMTMHLSQARNNIKNNT